VDYGAVPVDGEETASPAAPSTQQGVGRAHRESDAAVAEAVLKNLDAQFKSLLEEDPAKLQACDLGAKRVLSILSRITSEIGLEGDIKAFGSFFNGLKRGSSDLDVSFLSTSDSEPVDTVALLGQVLKKLPDSFVNVTKVFLASTPLIKFTDAASGLEVDFCINNRLGIRNTRLLAAYCECDPRVRQLGRLVKDWARAHGLVGTADGYINSYAWMLLVVHFSQQVSPSVVPNLQLLATEPVPITDRKWGFEDVWDTKFYDDLESLPRSENTMTVSQLLVSFFHHYTSVFDWSKHAVCIRLNREFVAVDKFSLPTPTNADQWYVEDPFDLRHNLAGKCTPAARRRILDAMRESHQALLATGQWAQACPSRSQGPFLLRCRITDSITPELLQSEFQDCGLVRLHYPRPQGGRGQGQHQAFLEFASALDRRRGHARNETYIADCQVCMMDSTVESFNEARSACPYSTHEVSATSAATSAGATARGDVQTSQVPWPGSHEEGKVAPIDEKSLAAAAAAPLPDDSDEEGLGSFQ